MQNIRSFKAPLVEHARQQYTQYLQDQLQKLSTFMLYQKKQNQKHNSLISLIEDQSQKIKLLNDKVLLMELYQNQNLKNHQKLFNSVQKNLILQKRVNKLQYYCFDDKLSGKKSNGINPNQDMKKQLILQINQKITNMHEQLCQQMITRMQKIIKKNLSQNVNSNSKQRNQNSYHMKQIKKKIVSKDNMSPLQTNYTQNDRSRIKQLQKNLQRIQKQTKPFQLKKTNFVNQRLSKLQTKLTSQKDNKDSSLHSSMQQSQIYYEKQRSPISAYLKKQNEYNSNKQNIDLTNRVQQKKPFYSEHGKKINKSSKTTKRSKSKSKSNRSVQKSSRSKSKDQCMNKICDFGLKKGDYNAKKVVQNNEVNTQRISNKSKSIHQIFKKPIKLKQDKNYKKKQKCKKKSNNTSRISHLSISQNSNHSNCSRSRSNSKLSKNQKQYKMYCNKFH